MAAGFVQTLTEAAIGMSDLLEAITEVMREVFEDDALEVDRQTTAADVAGWDSLQHVTLVLRVEARFGIRLTSAEVADLRDIGHLVDIVQQHLARR